MDPWWNRKMLCPLPYRMLITMVVVMIVQPAHSWQLLPIYLIGGFTGEGLAAMWPVFQGRQRSR